ncbi:class I SAM-dependent methyltransferase [Devosia rhodophyticola]|uniref:Class I SAM-dependent methyltransferase n=1 Tax=Devosia rhodophyticola TaxID=3026423 RepID=A0ABY7Z1G9_9HYPH|nr:class I SAM-dependent methyltransferase [Devosia rhodophyticola]WDR07060.1 class I SAM-dependent methyltransferase [Devosia rhodophyticola]
MANDAKSNWILDQDGMKEQYRDAARLARRANIFQYGTAPIGWFDWVALHAHLPDGANVLEVGCGPGWLWTAKPMPEGLSLTLTDQSEGMVSEALARVRALDRFPTVKGRTADVAALPFPDNSFDVVLACHMLYHVPDPQGALDEMIRVLRPGGTILVTTNSEDNMSEMYSLAHAAWGGLAVDPSGESFGMKAATDAMKARLKEVEVEISSDMLKVTDAEAIVGSLTSYPPGDRASQAQLATLRAMIIKRMAENDGIFTIAKRSGLIRGHKAQ